MTAPEVRTPAGGPANAEDRKDAASVPYFVADAKRLATLRAELALRGHELERADDGTFLVGKWGLTRSLESLDDVEDFVRQIGGAK